jgi:asparagine synthase (glutamine-hydrolysing)
VSRIAGAVSAAGGPPARELVEGMLAASAAGPGGATAVEARDGAALGSRGGPDPKLAATPRTTVVLDGAVYNRSELGGSGDDAALIAGLHEEIGFERALERLNGDFAVALHDRESGVVWLARDRFGVKPLYFAEGDGVFGFASRPRALFGVPGVSKELNRQFVALFAASHYRTIDNQPDRSPYEDIAQLPAAHLLRLANGRTEVRRWWSLEADDPATGSEEELAERYRELLLDAVGIRVESAGRPAFTLSGGMDSSTVLACAVERTGSKQDAYSSVYEDATYDESDEIRSMLDSSVERWHQVKIGTPDLVATITEMIEVNDEPVATATWLSHYLLCGEVAEGGFDTLLGGLGGDELNAGEYEYFFYFFADLVAAGKEDELEHETRKWIEHHDHPVFRKSFDVMRDGLDRLVDLSTPGRCLPDRARLLRYAPALNHDYFDLDSFEPVMDHPFSSYLANRTFQDIYRETAPCCLRAADRQCTAYGLEVMWPFFDHRLVELMFAVPNEMKIRDGVTKRLLRDATEGLLPEETRTRIKKTGWNAPAHDWFSGAGRELLLEIVEDERFRSRGIYEPAEVRRLIDEHEQIVRSGRPADNHMMFLWQLVNLELWMRWLDAT